MTKKRLRKLYNYCIPRFMLYCRESLKPGQEFLRPMYDKVIKTVYYSFETWYNKVRKAKNGKILNNEEIYYEYLWHWHDSRSDKLDAGLNKYLARKYGR